MKDIWLIFRASARALIARARLRGFLAASVGLVLASLAVADRGAAESLATPMAKLGDSKGSPIATFTVSATEVTSGEEVAFDASGSINPDGKPVKRYVWDFGDGTVRVSVKGKNKSPQISHIYTVQSGKSALYTCTLTVRGKHGTASAQTQITVSQVTVGPARGSQTLSGALLIATPSAVDSDVRDPDAVATPNGDIDHAQPIPNPVTVSGRVGNPDFTDVYAVTVNGGESLSWVGLRRACHFQTEPYMRLCHGAITIFDENRNQLYSTPDSGTLTFTDAGLFYVRMSAIPMVERYEIVPALTYDFTLQAATAPAAGPSLVEQLPADVVSPADTSPLAGPIGVQHVVVVNPQTGIVYGRVALNGVTDGYRFAFPNIGPGTYRIYTGTDLDGDQWICESNEFCGEYPSLADPRDVVVTNTDIDRLDVSVDLGSVAGGVNTAP